MVQWHCCTVDLCEYQSRYKHALKDHMAARHGADVKWYCPVEDSRTGPKVGLMCGPTWPHAMVCSGSTTSLKLK